MQSDMYSPLDADDSDPCRTLQRAATTDLSFFTPSSVSFNPKPYFPHPGHAQNRIKSASSSSLQREPSSSALQQKSLDVSPNDPEAIFIRYPFNDFPDSHPEGLTYNLMADNLNWFLDPADFRTENDTDPSRVPYPQILEPPRGWCPTKKKDVKERGAEAYGGEDAPKLRCTFCRRGYAGVNAKSMWRRHVLEKHKIPMANRRDGPTEGGGRGRSSSNKENKRVGSTGLDKANSFTVQSFFKPKQKELATTLPVPKGITENRSSHNLNVESSSPTRAIPDEVPVIAQQSEEVRDVPRRSNEPEFVPDDDAVSCSSRRTPQLTGHMLPPSSPLEEGASHMAWLDLSTLSPSPMRTPGRLAKKRSQFKMPWKFPSPSHPLYSSPDELCLGVPIMGMTGEGLRSSYVAVQASPFPGTGAAGQSQFSSPVAASPLSQKPVTGRVLGWKRSKDRPKSKLPPLPEPSPRRPLYTGPLPVPMSEKLDLTPNLTMSTDGEADTSFSTLGDPFSTDAFSNWFDLSSPNKGDRERAASGFLDTPLRRSASTSAIEKLQLADSGKEEEPSSMLLPSGFGLGFNFKIDLSTSGAKRARSEDQTDDNCSDEFGDLLYPSTQEPPASSQRSNAGLSKHKSVNSPFSSTADGSLEREDFPPTDLDSDDLETMFGYVVPTKKRRLCT